MDSPRPPAPNLHGQAPEGENSRVMPGSDAYFERWRATDALVEVQAPVPLLPLMKRLWPICRSITGLGVRQTLEIISEHVAIERHAVSSGTQCFDWIVPPEWNIRDAYVKDATGRRVIDFQQSNLHIVNYSVPVRARMTLAELQPHLHSLSSMPDAIPYRASYYNRTWGFCLSHTDRLKLQNEEYEVVVDSTLEPGQLDYGQMVIGQPNQPEVLLSTYVCHPSLANNELSGPVVQTFLLQLLATLPPGRFTYRGVFAPETIGVIAFLSQHLSVLEGRVAAGYVVSCVGDDGPFTYVRSRRHRQSLTNRAAEHVLPFIAGDKPVLLREHDPLGSDERQYCSPGINWPIGSILRSRYGEYPEYHTSKDDLAFVSEAGLQGALTAYLRTLQAVEINCRPLRTNPFCEPQLGRRNLYPTMVTGVVDDHQRQTLHLLAYADGDHDLIDIAQKLGQPIWTLLPAVKALVKADIIRLAE